MWITPDHWKAIITARALDKPQEVLAQYEELKIVYQNLKEDWSNEPDILTNIVRSIRPIADVMRVESRKPLINPGVAVHGLLLALTTVDTWYEIPAVKTLSKTTRETQIISESTFVDQWVAWERALILQNLAVITGEAFFAQIAFSELNNLEEEVPKHSKLYALATLQKDYVLRDWNTLREDKSKFRHSHTHYDYSYKELSRLMVGKGEEDIAFHSWYAAFKIMKDHNLKYLIEGVVKLSRKDGGPGLSKEQAIKKLLKSCGSYLVDSGKRFLGGRTEFMKLVKERDALIKQLEERYGYVR